MPTDKRERQRAGREARRAQARAAQKRAQRRRQIISIVALLAVVIGIGLFINLSGGDTASDPTATTTTEDEPQAIGTSPCPAADGTSEKKASFDGPPRPCLEDGVEYAATVETDVGSFTIDLDRERAPQTVNNFVFLARYHAYDGVPFHRVIKDFVVQGGDVALKNGSGDAGYKFPDELPDAEDYEEGSVAMANSGPDTNGSQFYVVVSEAGAQTLVQAAGGEAKYSLFGKVTEGMDVVKKIEADGSVAGTPTVVHKIVKVTITEQEG
ncbi:MAG TPA: peptidylprolyl isomerase [Acidimicrobiales bacterium]|nr:peptidylprolyl isomerase [Acidimicrobiales bacterium]